MRAKLLRLKEAMERAGIEVLIALSPENIFYLTGLRTYLGTPNRATFNSPRLSPGSVAGIYDGQSVDLICNSSWARMVEEDCKVNNAFFYPTLSRIIGGTTPTIFADNALDALVKLLAQRGYLDATTIGVEMNFIPVNLYLRLSERFPKAKFVDATNLFLQNREIKDEAEVEKIRKAAAKTAEAISETISNIKEGMAESDLLYIFKSNLLQNGLDWNTTTIGAGYRSAEVQNIVSGAYRVKKGDFIRFDVGGIFEGYCADVSRCASLGQPLPEVAQLYQSHLKAQEQILTLIRPDQVIAEVYKAGLEILHQCGHADYTPKRLGHGIGLTAHELPSFGPEADGVFKPGMVITVEVPFYIREVAGFNIENNVLVTEQGIEVLDKTSKELIII
ncbi:putative peptidase [Moorella mulderi DSM 14980]|uniref:Putative peptidase n=1 Tax=Moorella mulderi DSM 14980 TaxID=1122241 RepID=A0A151ASX8_9FIRM|nr:putative peptidase [Moorella mulderi DSM 14980]